MNSLLNADSLLKTVCEPNSLNYVLLSISITAWIVMFGSKMHIGLNAMLQIPIKKSSKDKK